MDPELLDLLGLQDHRAKEALLDLLDQEVTAVKAENRDRLVHLDQVVLLDQEEPRVKLDNEDHPDLVDRVDLQENLVNVEDQDPQDHLENQGQEETGDQEDLRESLEKVVHQVLQAGLERLPGAPHVSRLRPCQGDEEGTSHLLRHEPFGPGPPDILHLRGQRGT